MTRTMLYRRFVASMRRRYTRCRVCGGTPAQVHEPLHPHHLLPVKLTDARHALASDSHNVVMVCSSCHRLMHPLCRRWGWEGSSQTRSQALR